MSSGASSLRSELGQGDHYDLYVLIFSAAFSRPVCGFDLREVVFCILTPCKSFHSFDWQT